MATVRVTRKGSEIFVESPYNTLFIAAARRLYGRWREGAWWFDFYLHDRVLEALREIYGTDGESTPDTVTVRVVWKQGAEVVQDGVVIAGRYVATAHPNGADVTLSDGVELEAGLFFALAWVRDVGKGADRADYVRDGQRARALLRRCQVAVSASYAEALGRLVLQVRHAPDLLVLGPDDTPAGKVLRFRNVAC